MHDAPDAADLAPGEREPELADAVNTLTHELYHALGVGSEAKAECFAMQSTPMVARLLGVPRAYAGRLGRLTLAEYGFLEPLYRDARRCRDGGALGSPPRLAVGALARLHGLTHSCVIVPRPTSGRPFPGRIGPVRVVPDGISVGSVVPAT